MKKLLLLFAVLLFGGLTAATFTACSDDDDDPVAIDSTSIPVRWAIEYEFEWGGDAANQAELQKFLGKTYIESAGKTESGMKYATSVTGLSSSLKWNTSAEFKLVADVSENYTPSLDSLLLDWTCDIQAVAYNNKGEVIPGLVAQTKSTGWSEGKVALTEENIASMRAQLFPVTDKITFTAEDNYISFTRR